MGGDLRFGVVGAPCYSAADIMTPFVVGWLNRKNTYTRAACTSLAASLFGDSMAKKVVQLTAAYVDDKDKEYALLMRRELPNCTKTKQGYKSVSVQVQK